MKFKVDKTVLASVALHVLVLGWTMLSFSTKAVEVVPETVGVDISLEPSVAAGMKTGKKEEKKPLVEKVAEAKTQDDVVGKISEKQPVVTETAPQPQPKVEEKPVEKKPDPPKPVAEKPKEEPKPIEKKPDPKVDPIAEAIKKEEKKPPPKPVAQPAAKPPEQKQKLVERHFDQTQIAALLDKRESMRQAVAGDTLNSNAALGTAKGKAADNSSTWSKMFEDQFNRCWKPPFGGPEIQYPTLVIDLRMRRDGTLEAPPFPEATMATPYLRVYQESAVRAIIECQPYKLPPAFYDEWKYWAPMIKPPKA